MIVVFIFQRQLSIIDFTLNYPPNRNKLTSASLLSMLSETDYLNYPPIRYNLTSASLLSIFIETDYNFKKIAEVFFGLFLRVLFKRIHSVWNCLFIKQNAKLVQHNHLLFERSWGYLFCSIRLSKCCPFRPVVSKSCNRTEFGQTYRTNRMFTVLTY